MTWRTLLPTAAIAVFFVLILSAWHLWSANDRLRSDNVMLTEQRDSAYQEIDKIQIQQNRAAELDKRTTEKLHASESENNRLRNELTVSKRKLRIKAKCPATTTGSVGNDTSVELTSASGQTVFDIRGGIIEDQAKVEYLQGYINNLCLSK
ncbi:lysis protein [Limnobaculum xujianqingii]|uniref:lysis protein n=1 Tax=Limnobaculum xujianqingii TaxID=2738837 RepID=UPI00112931E0|nr:lysis protein [Limnobaculum xujianqingii]